MQLFKSHMPLGRKKQGGLTAAAFGRFMISAG
jgi:hypothetical protein